MSAISDFPALIPMWILGAPAVLIILSWLFTPK